MDSKSTEKELIESEAPWLPSELNILRAAKEAYREEFLQLRNECRILIDTIKSYHNCEAYGLTDLEFAEMLWNAGRPLFGHTKTWAETADDKKASWVEVVKEARWLFAPRNQAQAEASK